MNLRAAISHINRSGALLVFPINNKKEPPSLWSAFFPCTKMRWEWDESGSQAVSDLWHLREKLSTSGQVVYSKWFRGRATLISRSLFPALLRSLNPELPVSKEALKRSHFEKSGLGPNGILYFGFAECVRIAA